MYGRIQYCMKHGHDWAPLHGEGASLQECECRICGARQVFL